ncbi:MAG: hypothetical protein RLZZ67_12 [Candidatus Parcubacteria bacterium]
MVSARTREQASANKKSVKAFFDGFFVEDGRSDACAPEPISASPRIRTLPDLRGCVQSMSELGRGLHFCDVPVRA